MFADAGLQVVGISYDSPAILKKFSDQNQIPFPLLSDPGSKTIDAYHIRNASARGKAEGTPEPGTFVVDSTGTIRAKLFLKGIRDRHTSAELVKAAQGVK